MVPTSWLNKANETVCFEYINKLCILYIIKISLYENGSLVQIYLDGTLASKYYQNNIPLTNAPVYLGNWGWQNSIRAYYTQYRVYNRTLTEEEIGQLASEVAIN